MFLGSSHIALGTDRITVHELGDDFDELVGTREIPDGFSGHNAFMAQSHVCPKNQVAVGFECSGKSVEDFYSKNVERKLWDMTYKVKCARIGDVTEWTYYRSDWTEFKKKFDVGKEFDRNQDLILIGFRSRIEDNYDYNVPRNWMGKRRKNWYIKRGFQFYFAEAKSVTYIHDGDEKKRAEWTISDPGEEMDFVTKDGTQMYVNDLYCKTAKDEIREFKFKMGSVNVQN